MPTSRTAQHILGSDFLQVRHWLIDVGAVLDRIDRGFDAATVVKDPRLELIKRAIAVLGDGRENRAERIQMVFSDPYDAGWQP